MISLNIAQFPLPILTGIGHERDESVADMVAHTKLKTPTAVAEFIIERIGQFSFYLNDLKNQFIQETSQLINNETHRIEIAAHRFQPLITKALAIKNKYPFKAAQRLDYAVQTYFDKQESFYIHVKDSIHYLTKKQVRSGLQKQRFIATQLKIEVNSYLKNQQQKLHLANKTIQLSDPQNILKKGYSITSINNKVIKDIIELKEGDEICTQTSKGRIISRVEKLKSGK